MDHIVAKQDEDLMLRRIKDNVLGRKDGTQDDWGAQIDRKGILRINN